MSLNKDISNISYQINYLINKDKFTTGEISEQNLVLIDLLNVLQKKRTSPWKFISTILICFVFLLGVFTWNINLSVADLDYETYNMRMEYYDKNCKIRGNINSKIYHTIESPYYQTLKPSNVECFDSEIEASKHYRKIK